MTKSDSGGCRNRVKIEASGSESPISEEVGVGSLRRVARGLDVERPALGAQHEGHHLVRGARREAIGRTRRAGIARAWIASAGRIPFATRAVKRARVDRDVGADLAVALARGEVARALAHAAVEVLLGQHENRVVGDSGGGLSDLVHRGLPRHLEALHGQLAPRPPLALRHAVLRGKFPQGDLHVVVRHLWVRNSS